MDNVGDTLTRQFLQFPNLPKEIRLLIWEECMLAIPAQVLDLSTIMDESQSEDGMNFTIKPPLLSRVCRESRDVALKTGRSFLLSHRYQAGQPARETASVRTWFSGQRDLVELAAERGYCKKREWVFDGEMQGLLACVQHVMLQPGADAELLATIARPGACPRLRAVDVMLERFEVTDAEAMNSADVVDFFGEDRLVLLDIEDIVRAREVLKRCPGWPHSPYWVKSWYDFSAPDSEAMAGTIAQAKDRVTDAWLRARLPALSTTDGIDGIDPTEHDDEARKAKEAVVAGMPSLRVVRCCDWPYAEMDIDTTIWTWRDDVALKTALDASQHCPEAT